MCGLVSHFSGEEEQVVARVRYRGKEEEQGLVFSPRFIWKIIGIKHK